MFIELCRKYICCSIFRILETECPLLIYWFSISMKFIWRLRLIFWFFIYTKYDIFVSTCNEITHKNNINFLDFSQYHCFYSEMSITYYCFVCVCRQYRNKLPTKPKQLTTIHTQREHNSKYYTHTQKTMFSFAKWGKKLEPNECLAQTAA